jgi:uncharacterized protein
MLRVRRELMLIESTYIFPAPVADMFAAVTDPDRVRDALPGCERLIQLGPPDDQGTTTWEMRLRLGPDAELYTGSVTIEPLSQPTHVGVSGRVQGPSGPWTLRGSVDLVGQDDHNSVMAYVWDIETGRSLDVERENIDPGAAAQWVRSACERLAQQLRATGSDGAALADALPLLRADTARGKIILLPPEPPPAPLPVRLWPAMRGSAWVAAGLAAGVLAIALAASIIRRWGAEHGAPRAK